MLEENLYKIYYRVMLSRYRGKTIVRLGKVSPKLLKEFDIDQDCFYAEIELEVLFKVKYPNPTLFKNSKRVLIS